MLDTSEPGSRLDAPLEATGASAPVPTPRPLARWRRRLGSVIAQHPSIYLPLARLRRANRETVIRRDTEVVIEGFPRSANSFAVAAFRLAQPHPVRMAHHSHAAATVLAAARWNIPTLVLFRDPDEAVTSMLMRSAHNLHVRDGFRYYSAFYQRILSLRSSYVLASFDTATRRLGTAIRKLNERFGTDFAEFEHTDEMVSRAFEALDRFAIARGLNDGTPYGPFRDHEHIDHRASRKATVRQWLLKPEFAGPREQALAVFHTLNGCADC